MLKLLVFSALLFVITFAESAHANCGIGNSYQLRLLDNDKDVRICLENGSSACLCSKNGGILRENVDTGEVVLLGDYCDSGTSSTENQDLKNCCLDECVEPGTYRYGFKKPFSCSSGSLCSGTEVRYYETIHVPETEYGCSLSHDNPGTTPYDEDPPWEGDEDGVICVGDYGIFGCSIVAPGAGSIFGFNLVLVLMGVSLALFRMRRRRNDD